jgi:hypothetical protein
MRRCIPLLAAVGILMGLATPPSGVAQDDTRTGGLATDQPCAPTVAVDELVPTGVAVDELVPMVLTQEQLGATDPEWTEDIWFGRYSDDAELAHLGLFSDPDICDRLVEFGRVTGYSGSWELWTDDVVDRRASSVHLFLDERGAAGFLAWLPEQLPGPPSRDDGQGGTDVLEEVVTKPIPGLGPGAAAMLVRRTSGTQAWAWFQRGAIVGTVTLVESEASIAEATRLAGDLAERIAAAPRTGLPWDATALLSAGLPLEELGAAYAGFEWAWWFGGCWDAAESAEQSADAEALTERNARTGFLVRCAAMYEPPPPTEMLDCEDTPEPRVVRISSLVTPFKTEEGAATAWAESLAEAEEAGGADFERFDVPGVEGAVGTRRLVSAGDVTYTSTRVEFLHGPAIVAVFIHDQSETDHRAEMADLAVELAERVEQLLPLAPATSGPGSTPGGLSVRPASS